MSRVKLVVWLLLGWLALAGTGRADEVDDLLAKQPAPDQAQADAAGAMLVKLGPEAIARVCARLVAPGAGDDNAARYALSGVVKYAGRQGAPEAERRLVSQALQQALKSATDSQVKAFLIEQLALAGGLEAVTTLGQYLKDEALCDPAAHALQSIGNDAAARELLAALPAASGVNRVTLIQSAGALSYPEVAPALVPYVTSDDMNTRLAVLYALANSGAVKAGGTDVATLINRARQSGTPYEKMKATSYNLHYAQQLQKNGHVRAATRIARELLGEREWPGKKTEPADLQTRCAALTLLAETSGPVAPELLAAANGDEPELRAAALRLAAASYGKNSFPRFDESVTRRWVREMDRASSPTTRLAIIKMLSERGDPSALPALLAQTKNSNPEVRQGAIEEAIRLGGKNAIPAMLGLLKDGNPEDLKTFKAALLQMPRGDFFHPMAAAYPGASAEGKVLILDLFAARQATDYSPLFFTAAGDGDVRVRLAACKGLAVATPRDVPRLLGLMLEAGDEHERAAAQDAVVAVAHERQHYVAALVAAKKEPAPGMADDGTSAVLQALGAADAAHRPALLATAGRIGGPAALAAVKADLKNPDATVREAAARALADWPDASALPDLLELIKAATSDKTRVLAERGYLRLAGDRKDISERQRFQQLYKAMGAIANKDELKPFIAAVAGTGQLEALQVIEPYLADEALKADDAPAVARLAGDISRENPNEAREALTRLAAATTDEAVKKQAVEILAQLPPEGFVYLFNGKDLTGWKGLLAAPLDNPVEREKTTSDTLAKAQAAADADMRAHWSVDGGVLVFDGKGRSLATARDYGDFEMLVDWKIGPGGDSGVYLRGAPQVQIWDPVKNPVGSGGLYNNQKNPSTPSLNADRPVGEWNTFRIKMVGDRVTVKLNDKLVVDNILMENYWDRARPIFPTGQIELQNHGAPLYFRNIYIRELPRKDEWRALLNGRDLYGWTTVNSEPGAWGVENGVTYTTGEGGGWLSTIEQYDNYELSLEFRLPPGGNSGVFLRTPRQGDSAYTGMEIQLLDDPAAVYKDLKPWQYTGSVYGISPSERGHTLPPGQWQQITIRAEGPHIQIWLNGAKINDADLNKYKDQLGVHPGIARAAGYIGLQNHTDRVEFRNVKVRALK